MFLCLPNPILLLLYKAQKPSVRPTVPPITQSCQHGLMQDLHDATAMSSGIS